MNTKVIGAFISFIVLLAVWIALTLLKNPDLAGLLDFVKGATMTAWTACALFFETASVKTGTGTGTGTDSSPATTNVGSEPNPKVIG